MPRPDLVLMLAGALSAGCTDYGFNHAPLTAEPIAGHPRGGSAETADTGGDTGWRPTGDTASEQDTEVATPQDTGTATDPEPAEDKCYEPEDGYDTNPATLIGTRDDSTPITISFVLSDTSYQDDLYLDTPESRFLVHAWEASAGDIGTFGPYAKGTEVSFGIGVNNTGDYWRSGLGSRNADGQAHVAVTYEGDCQWLIGFEDLYGGGDRDYNDVVLRVAGNLYEM
jgi:hypothetical protein